MMSAGRTGRRAAGQVAVTAVRANNRTADRGGDSGLATVWAATAVAVLIGVLVAMLDLAAAVGARHRAEAAADLAALAAAGQAVRGAESACVRADAVAGGTGGRVVLCRVQGWNADVEVEVGVRLSMLGTVTVHGRARAGPVGGRVRADGTDEHPVRGQ
jgi:secretion/DNA translocation related TadE-like protein